jgi:polysaccharide deacetylase family protein (PEP-CTERM system associated)
LRPSDDVDLSARRSEHGGTVTMPPHLFTVVLEDYFQVGAFRDVVDRRHWYRFESRIERTAIRVLELLQATESRATFFVLGAVAEEMPELIRRIADAGHEVADRGFHHLRAASLDRSAFLDDVRRGREAVARASGHTVVGHRCCDWLPPQATDKLDLLAAEGYAYDSSLRPIGLATAERRKLTLPFTHRSNGRSMQELPVSSAAFGPILLPTAGGAWLRHLPAGLTRRAASRAGALGVPLVSCIHSWELDPEQPRLATSWLTTLRHYRNLDSMEARLHQLLAGTPTTSIASWMEIAREPHHATVTAEHAGELGRARLAEPVAHTGAPAGADLPCAARDALSIVIPCFNEGAALGYLDRTLASVVRELSVTHDVELVFVDDGSSDDTWAQLAQRFGARTDCRLIRHERNRGIGAAIRTGVTAARAPIVASIDADCSYDPHQIGAMLRQLTPGVAMVTASPYHPRGAVRNVPGWRLLLSRGLSRMYRGLMRDQIYTITSCCRIYRRNVVLSIPTQYDDYRGIAEWLVRLSLAGGRIVEHPTVLHSRIIGTSKMRVARSILGHVRLLAQVAGRRMTGTRDLLQPDASLATRAVRDVKRHAVVS